MNGNPNDIEVTLRFLEALLDVIRHDKTDVGRQAYGQRVADVAAVRDLIRVLDDNECLVPVMMTTRPDETDLNRMFDFSVAFTYAQAHDYMDRLIRCMEFAREWMHDTDGLPTVLERLLEVIVKIVEAARHEMTTIRDQRADYWLAMAEEAVRELQVEHRQPEWAARYTERLESIHTKWRDYQPGHHA